jgi:ATP adenylyltransferase
VDRLWSPWRLEYVSGARQTNECIFCEAPRPPHPDSLIVFEGTTSYVILNLYPYNNGHLMIVPRRHVASLTGLSRDELLEVGVLTQRSEAALSEAYKPHGFNIGINLGKPAGAGVLDHVHVHVVPRWNGDTNFVTVIGEMRVLPENLGDSAARLRPIFERLGSAG